MQSRRPRAPATITSSDSSPAGHDAPAPSAPQNIPNEVIITPTTNFIVFSGTLAKGARAAMPATRTIVTASPAAAAAMTDVVLIGSKGEHDERDLQPLEQDSFEGDRKRVTVKAQRACCPQRAPVGLRSNAARSSWTAFRPAARRIALRSHCKPNTSNRPPIAQTQHIDRQFRQRSDRAARPPQPPAQRQRHPHRPAPKTSRA